jgi:hypothetical protein
VLSIAGLLGAAIESIHMETSVSTLFSKSSYLAASWCSSETRDLRVFGEAMTKKSGG